MCFQKKQKGTDPVTNDIFSLTEGVSNGRIRQWKKYEHESIVVSLTVYKVQEEHGFSVTSLFSPSVLRTKAVDPLRTIISPTQAQREKATFQDSYSSVYSSRPLDSGWCTCLHYVGTIAFNAVAYVMVCNRRVIYRSVVITRHLQRTAWLVDAVIVAVVPVQLPLPQLSACLVLLATVAMVG